MADQSEGCWWAMPAETEDEICRKALELLSDLCSKGEVQDDNCLDFIYYFRDLGRPRYTDSGQASMHVSLSLVFPFLTSLRCWQKACEVAHRLQRDVGRL